MKTETVDGKRILVFDDLEEMKWYYHKELCKGDATAQYLMEHCNTLKEANHTIKTFCLPCIIKET